MKIWSEHVSYDGIEIARLEHRLRIKEQAENKRRRGTMVWFPIFSYSGEPNQPVLVWDGQDVLLAWWDSTDEAWRSYRRESAIQPTHWMLLPEPPEPSA